MTNRTVEEQLRDRAQELRDNRDKWVQGEPKAGQMCAMFNGTSQTTVSVFDHNTSGWLQKWLVGYVRANWDGILTDCEDDSYQVTEFNDQIAQDVDEVIAMLEKAAADVE